MPEYTRGQLRDKTYAVHVAKPSFNIFYAFVTYDLVGEPGINTDDLNALGFIGINELPADSLYFLRAQAPKPGRAKKILRRNPTVIQKGSISTFYGHGKEREILARGWKLLQPSKEVSVTKNSRTTTALADLSNGLIYAFPLNTKDFETYGSALGLKDISGLTSETRRARVISGTSRPKPPRAKIVLSGGAVFQSFYSVGAEETVAGAGFSRVRGEILA